VAQDLRTLTQLQGDISVLSQAENLSANVAEAIAELRQVAELVQARMPEVNIYFDLSELRGYHYHTGLVFAAYAPGIGQAVANGGRCDDIGAVFGRSRPAIGFNTDLKTLLKLLPTAESEAGKAIFAPANKDLALWQRVQELRAQGEQVICGLSEQQPVAGCDRQLQFDNGQWQIKPLKL
jgi:ATP phosphoribosyltransferase regulatory subunit